MSSYFRDPLPGVPSAHRAPNPPSLEPLRYLPPSQGHRQHLASPSQPYFQHYPSDDAHYTHYQPPRAQRTDFSSSPPHRPSEERDPQGITCSSCKSWVSLDELGGHVCQTRRAQGDLRIEVNEARGKDGSASSSAAYGRPLPGYLDRSPPDTPGTPSSQPISSPASTAASSIPSPSGTRLPFFEKYQKLVDSSSPGMAGVGAYSRSPNLSPRLGAPSLPHAPLRSPTSPLPTSTSAPNLSVPTLDRQNSFPAPSLRQRPPEPSRSLEPSYLSASPPQSRNVFPTPRLGDRSPSLKPSRSTPADLSTYTSQPPTRPSPRLNDPVADLDACLEDLRIMAKGEDDDGGAQEMLDDFINGRKTDSIGYSDERGAQTASVPIERTAKEQCTLCTRHLSHSDVDVRRTSNRQPLCRACYVERFLPKCRKCENPIEGGAVTSSDGKIVGKYHRDCFNCFDCAAPFPDGEFYVYDGKPYCQLHYHALNGSLCANAGCGKPIEGSCVSLVGEENGGGGRYHPHCFNCSTCHSPLLEHHFVVDRRPFCEAHAVRRRPQKAGTASEREERAKKRQTIITRR